MSILEHPEIRLEPIGRLRTRSASEVTSSPLGVGFETLDRRMFTPDRCYEKAGLLGVKHVRLQTGWSRCETKKGVYDFGWLDEAVDSLLARGLLPWFNLGYGNRLYMPEAPHPAAVGCVPHGYGAECVAAWQAFVTALAVHFRGRVRDYEIWNEPNIPYFWIPLVCSGREYAKMVRYTACALRAADPDAVPGGCCNGIACAFAQEALEAGMGEDIAFFSVHPYREVPEQNFENDAAALHRIFRRFAPRVALWQGECGYPSTAYGNSSGWMHLVANSEEAQAHYTARRIVLDAAAGFERIQYFHISDLVEGENVQSSGKPRLPIMLGLLRGGDYSEKPSYSVMRNFATIFDDECTPADLLCNLELPGYSGYVSGVAPLLMTKVKTFVRKGFPLYAWYYPESLQKEWKGLCGLKLLGMRDTPNAISDPVVVDGLTGLVYRVSDVQYTDGNVLDRGEDENFNDFTHNMFVVRGLPLLDYPLLLTDAAALDVTVL